MAVLVVVLYHGGGILPGGFVGVDIFFVISGFVITLMVKREMDRDEDLSLRRFFARRARRILPALALMTVVTLALGIGLLNPISTQPVASRTARSASMLIANAHLYSQAGGYFGPISALNPFLHTWSLSVEEQFYIVFPLAIAILWRVSRRWSLVAARRIVFAALVAAGVISFVLSIVLTRNTGAFGIDEGRALAFYASPTRAWEFLAGAFLALGASSVSALPRGARHVMSWSGLAIVVATVVRYNDATTFPGLGAVLPVVGAVLLIAGGSHREGRLPLIDHPVAQWVGDRSYSWYLWHWPFVVFTRIVVSDAMPALAVASVMSLVPASLSYRFVEEPIRRATWSAGSTRSRRSRSVVLVAACVALPILLASGIVVGAERSWGSDTVEDLAVEQRPHVDVVRGCDHEADALEIDRCLLPAGRDAAMTAGADRGLVVLLGDSDAGAISEVVADAANSEGFDLRMATLHGCFFADARIVEAGSDGAGCRASVLSLVQRAIATSPRAVVIATVTDRYLEEASGIARGSVVARGDDAMTAAAAEGLRSVIEQFDAAKIPVLVVQPIPKFRDWTFDTCSMIQIFRDVGSCGMTRDRDTVLRELAPAVSAGKMAVSGLGAVTVDVTDILCPGERCKTFDDGVWRYHDAVHLTVQGGRPLLDTFRSQIAAVTAGS